MAQAQDNWMWASPQGAGVPPQMGSSMPPMHQQPPPQHHQQQQQQQQMGHPAPMQQSQPGTQQAAPAWPQQFGSQPATTGGIEDEKPLLEELGIDFEHIKRKMAAVVNPFAVGDVEMSRDSDLAGPLFVALALGCALLLSGKVHFGYIYGFGMVGCVAIHTLLNLMCNVSVDMQYTVSSLGYCLVPILFCSLLAFSFVPRVVAGPLAVVFTVWAAWCATRVFEVALEMREQRWLILYPLVLLYALFTTISIF